MRKGPVLLSLLAIVAIPPLVRMAVFGAMPDGWGVFPPQQHPGVPGFDLGVFLLGLALAVPILGVLLRPRRWGFRAVAVPDVARPVGRLAPWFWPGLIVCLIFLAISSGLVTDAGAVVHHCFVPMWWGFILALDGLVYRRTGGASLLARRPATLAAIAVTSRLSWAVFEYLDYFVNENWYYPHNTIFTQTGYMLVFAAAYTTVMPALFEFYALLTTWPRLRARWSDGPRLALSPSGWRLVAWLGAASLVALVVLPAPLFPLLWLAPLLLLAGSLMQAGVWTPLTPLARGNWSSVVLVALACVGTYTLGEAWNGLSTADNPNFWRYDVPYVNVLHVFEMPALGYFGYIPFALVCWLWWLAHAALLGLRPAIDVIAGDGPAITD